MVKTLKGLLAGAAFALLSPVLLSGCAIDTVTLPQEDFSSWERNYERLTDLTFFKGTGRLGIFGNDGRVSASYDFEGLSGGFLLTLNSPLGTTLATATVTDNTLALTVDGQTYRDDYARAVFERAFGVSIPVDKLERIYLGIPGGTVSYDDAGRIVASSWDGYDITYSGILESQGLRLPKTIDVVSGGYRIKLSLNSFIPGVK